MANKLRAQLLHIALVFLSVHLLELGGAQPTQTNTTLRKVVIVMRHCIREPLQRSDVLIETGPQPQCVHKYDSTMTEVGIALRERYLRPLNATQHHPRVHHFESSNYDRTLETGQGIVESLFESTLVPIHATQENIDIKFHGYDKCSRFANNLRRFFASTEFQIKSNETKAFREKLAAPINESSKLENWFNVYDRYNLRYLYNISSAPLIPEDTYQQVVNLANWLESHKFNFGGKCPGSAILSEIREQLRRTANNTEYRFVLYFAHYPTMLSLLASMNFNASEAPANHVPPFLSYLVFELHEPTPGNFTVALLYNNGTSMMLPFTNPGPCHGVFQCPLQQFLNDTKKTASPTLTDFCQACKNCAQFSHNLGVKFPDEPLIPLVPSNSPDMEIHPVAAAVLGGAVVLSLFALGYLINYIVRRQMRKHVVQS